jgi:hypothetical protein
VELPQIVTIDVQMWTPLRGRLHDFTTVEADTPVPPPRDAVEWQRWTEAVLGDVAERDRWQSGRYYFTTEAGGLGMVARDHWEYQAA